MRIDGAVKFMGSGSEMTDVTGLLEDGDDEGEPTSPHNLKFHNPKI